MTVTAVQYERQSEVDSSLAGLNFDVVRTVTTVICVVVPALALAAGLRRVTVGWDDGAITAAFARTFAKSGKIALTPISEQVEGFSSLSWFVLLAAAYKLIHSFTGMLVFTKVASAACFSASLFSFRRVAARLLEPQYVASALVLLAFTVTPFNEVVNGMEMNFAMLLTLLLVEVFYWPAVGRATQVAMAGILSGLLLATRFEAPFLLLFLYAGLISKKAYRRAIFTIAGVNALEFAAMEVWRHKVFGLWLPNTIMAKRWAPYTQHGIGHMVGSRFAATGEIFTVLTMPILLLFALALTKRRFLGGDHRRKLELGLPPVILSFTVGGVAFGLLLGQNWGHPGRMILAFLPFMVLAIVWVYRAFAIAFPQPLQVLIPIVLVSQICAWFPLAMNAAHENLTSARKVLPIGLGADEVRTLLGKEDLSVFIPDVGASALCCEHLKIIDAGFLTNAYLAERGPAATAALIEATRPDLIETHSPWDRIEGMYTSEFAKQYGPVRANGVLFFLRRDLYKQLIGAGAQERAMIDSSGLCGQMPNDLHWDLHSYVGMDRCIEIR